MLTLALPLCTLADGLGVGVPDAVAVGEADAEVDVLGEGDGDSPQCGYKNVHELRVVTKPMLAMTSANFFMLFRLTLAAQKLRQRQTPWP
jgi:hypothetical protein